MIDQSEIDFQRLVPKQFEELCFDLLDELGFSRLVWRQGGADDGRDIQSVRDVRAGIVDSFEEVWFFECKRYKGGVPPNDLSSKVTWADAKRPNHLVFLVSSYLTRGAREWVSEIQETKPYRIHVVEGKRLQALVFKSPRLLHRYFSSSAQKLIQEAHRAWLHHNLVPEPWLLRTLADAVHLDEYSSPQLAFLWASLKVRSEELFANMEDSYSESYDIIFGMLKQSANTEESVFSLREGYSLIYDVEFESPYDPAYPKIYAAEVAHLMDQVEYVAMYCLVRDGEGEGIEVLVDQDNELTCRIRHIQNGARGELENAKKILHGRVAT